MKKATGWFFYSSGSLLLVTAAAKFISVTGDSKVLQQLDPILGLSFRSVFLVVASMEFAIGLICLFGRPNLVQPASVAWLSTTFVFYRTGLWWMGWHRSCSCLGNFTDALQISPQLADNIMKCVLAYLLIGSYGILIWQWRERQKQKVEIGNPKLGI